MLYTPLLPEAASGTIEPRHVVVPLRQALRRTLVRVGSATGVDLDRRTCTYVNAGGVECSRSATSRPCRSRGARAGLDWAVAAAFPRDVAELGTLGHPEPCRPPSRPESGEGSGSERERGVDRRREVSACLSAKTKRSFQAP